MTHYPCALLYGLDEVKRHNPGFDLGRTVHDPRYPDALKRGFLWHSEAVGLPRTWMVAGTRVHGADCSDADQLTHAEMEGRRQVRVIRDIVHDHLAGGKAVSLVALPAYIGIRETRHAVCLHRLTEGEVLGGVRFPDAIANGSRVGACPNLSTAVLSLSVLYDPGVYQTWVRIAGFGSRSPGGPSDQVSTARKTRSRPTPN